jgi:hypothetical protein
LMKEILLKTGFWKAQQGLFYSNIYPKIGNKLYINTIKS